MKPSPTGTWKSVSVPNIGPTWPQNRPVLVPRRSPHAHPALLTEAEQWTRSAGPSEAPAAAAVCGVLPAKGVKILIDNNGKSIIFRVFRYSIFSGTYFIVTFNTDTSRLFHISYVYSYCTIMIFRLSVQATTFLGKGSKGTGANWGIFSFPGYYHHRRYRFEHIGFQQGIGNVGLQDRTSTGGILQYFLLHIFSHTDLTISVTSI
jgi:hypothetical protein